MTAPGSDPKVDPKPELVRGLGTSAAFAIVLGTMIGTGIFLKPSEVAREGGSFSVAMAAWLGGGLLSMFGAMCYVELGAALPAAGGEYVYLSRGLGSVWGFLFGWMHSIVARPASAAAIAAGLLRFCSFFFPDLALPVHTFHPMGQATAHQFEFSITWSQLLVVAALIVITAINYLGVRVGGRVQVALTALKIGSVLAIIVCGVLLLAGRAHTPRPVWPASIEWGTLKGFLAALAATAWAYDGWNNLNLVGSEVQNPERNFPRVLIGGTAFVIVVFLLFNLVCLYAIPFSRVASSEHVATDVFESFAGRSAALWITLAMAISALGTLNSSVLSGARVNYAMARDGIFFGFTSKVHPKYRSPANALIFQCCVASLMALTGTFEDLTSLVMFGSWLFYALAVVAMMRMRRTEPDMRRPYRTGGYPIVPVLFVLGAVSLSAGLWLARPIRSTIGLLMVLAGLLFYRVWRERNQEKTEGAKT
jgi:APA family basic amino acid/polyamine antiporter